MEKYFAYDSIRPTFAACFVMYTHILIQWIEWVTKGNYRMNRMVIYHAFVSLFSVFIFIVYCLFATDTAAYDFVLLTQKLLRMKPSIHAERGKNVKLSQCKIAQYFDTQTPPPPPPPPTHCLQPCVRSGIQVGRGEEGDPPGGFRLESYTRFSSCI